MNARVSRGVVAVLFFFLTLGASAVTLEFPGANSIPEPELREALRDPLESIDREGLTPATADDAAFFVELFYRRRGFSRALVTATIVSRDRLRLRVDEGKLLRLGEVKFVGAKGLPEERLREYFLAPTRSRTEDGKKELPYIAGDLRSGLETLRTLYESEGYQAVRLEARPPVIRDDVVAVTVVIREGPQSRFGDLRFTGLPPGEPRRTLSWWKRKILRENARTPRQQLEADLALLAREPFTPATAQAMASKTEEYLKRRGHFRAEVRAIAGSGRGGRIPVTLAARPGPVLRFGEVRVSGTTRLKPAYVQNRFLALRGETYSPVRLDEVFAAEMRTGLFEILRVNPEAQPDGTLRLDVTVREARAREFGVSGGFSSYDGPLFGVEFRERNLFGTGRPISFRADYSARSIAGEVLYEDPHLFETENRLRVRLSLSTRSLDSYDKRELGLLVGINRKLSKSFELGVFVQARRVNLPKLAVSPFEAGDTDYFVPSVGLTATLDLRDSPLFPLRGLAVNASFDVASHAFGSDVEFLRATGRISYYAPLGKKTFLALGLRASTIRPLAGAGRSAIPIDERFFLGGATTVRSFSERRLGPRDTVTGNPTGGLNAFIFNAEYTFPIRGDLKGAVFYDAGALGRDAGLGSIRQAVGAGIRYALPIGPLRIDYGFNPSRKGGEAVGALHIAFGVAF